jgi:hypothetical protein
MADTELVSQALNTPCVSAHLSTATGWISHTEACLSICVVSNIGCEASHLHNRDAMTTYIRVYIYRGHLLYHVHYHQHNSHGAR